MREIHCVNYLHYGDGLSTLTETVTGFDNFTHLEEFPSLSDVKTSKYVAAILKHCQRESSKRTSVDEFFADIENSNKTRVQFRNLDCRGFSYKFYADLKGFPYRLKRRINLRTALIADDDLFYPPQVRKYLRRHTSNHYFVFGAPAIAFALGHVTRQSWYVFVMQSDLCKHGTAPVREHFRGWRKILFANIVAEARRTARNIFLCRGEDVLKSCHPDYPAPLLIPAIWKSIYDGTANDFDMRSVTMPRRIDIQLYDRKRPTYAKEMYRLDLVETKE